MEEALASGDVVASVFEDVPSALEKWRSLGVRLFVYSSLPSNAQRKYFESTEVCERCGRDSCLVALVFGLCKHQCT